MSPRTAWLILLARCSISSFAQVNVTVDDGDPAIVYTGTWTPSSSPLDAGGSHRLGEDDGVLAKFTFTGTAVYFMSPLWPYEVFTQLQLDSQPLVQLNLSDPNLAIPSRSGEETVQSGVVWGTANLPNVAHTLHISKAPGRPYAIVDTLIYTRLDPAPSSSSSSSSSSFIGSNTADSYATSPPVIKSSQSSVPVLTIALTTVFGFLGVCFVAVAFWVCCKSRQRQKAERRGVTGSPPLPAASQMGPLSPQIASEFKDTSWPISNSQMPSLAPVVPHPQPLIYQPSEIEQGFNPYTTPPQTRMTYQQFPNPCLSHKETLLYSPTSLSTITEKSTPVAGAAGSPVSLPSSDLSYYTPSSHSIKSGAARLSYASDTSPGVADSGMGHQRQAQPRLHPSGSTTLLRSPGSFGSLGHEVARPSKLKNGKTKQAAVDRVEDADVAESSRPPVYRLR